MRHADCTRRVFLRDVAAGMVAASAVGTARSQPTEGRDILDRVEKL